MNKFLKRRLDYTFHPFSHVKTNRDWVRGHAECKNLFWSEINWCGICGIEIVARRAWRWFWK
jgi:rRNA maturation endonuclease Nob1